MDLMHAVPFARTARVWSGPIDGLPGAAVTVIAAGAAQKPGETRLDLVAKNAAIFRDARARRSPRPTRTGSSSSRRTRSTSSSYLTWRISGLPSERVIGSGTILDTARFRMLLAEHYGVDPRSVHAHMAGEHGDSEVPVWSLGQHRRDAARATSGRPRASGRTPTALEKIYTDTRDAAYQIIERKGATYYAVAAGLVRIVEAILRDQHTVLSVSSLIHDYYGIDDVYLSLPAVIGRRRGRADRAAGAVRRGGVRPAPVGGAAARDDRRPRPRRARFMTPLPTPEVVTVYGAAWCGDCRRAKRFLEGDRRPVPLRGPRGDAAAQQLIDDAGYRRSRSS